MTKNLPPTFDEFSTEAKIDFLSEARSTHDIVSYLFALIDEDYTNTNGGNPRKEELARLYVHLLEQNQAQDQDAV